MFNVSFVADYEGIAFGEEELIRIVSHIAMKAEENFGPGIISKDLFVIDSDMDRIFISTDPDATKDSDADYIIRTWDYSCKSHLKGDLISEYISINWTFHIMGDCEDMEGRCSHDHCDGTDEIPLDDVNGFYSSSFDRNAFINKIRKSIIKPQEEGDEFYIDLYAGYDVSAIDEDDIELLRDLADNDDPEACYLYHQIQVCRSMNDGCYGGEFEDYITKAAKGGFSKAIAPYAYSMCFGDYFVSLDDVETWPRNKPFSVEEYTNWATGAFIEFVDFCEEITNSYPECYEDCLKQLKRYLQYFKNDLEELDWIQDTVLVDGESYKFYAGYVIAMKIFSRLITLPETFLDPLQEEYPDEFERFCDKDCDPFLGGRSLDKCLEDNNYPDLDYLFDRYGDEAIEYVFGLLSESTDYYDSETIKRLATVSKACAQEMEVCANVGQYGFDYEDIFKAIYLRLNLGEEFNNTVCGNDFNDFKSGGLTFESLINTYFEPELLKKYGLEVVTEHIIKALNCEIADDFWMYFDADEYPNFLNDLVPLLNEHIAKGSVDAANVLIKAFQAGKEGYFADVTHFTVPECVTDIPTDTFGGCKNLIAVALPDGLKRIGPVAFCECTGLSSITIPASVNKIGESVFEECESLTDVVLPDGLTEIENRVFAACTSLSSIKIPTSVNKIGKSAFEGCESLTDVVLPDGLTEIEDSVFADCTGLSSIKIPASVNKIGKYAFVGCESLTDVVLPDGLTEIEDYVFACCTGLSCITIPKGVIKIGLRAFMDLLNLSRVILPIGVKTIHADAFEGCDSLQEILVPAHKTDYYKKRLPSELWDKIVELDNSKK